MVNRVKNDGAGMEAVVYVFGRDFVIIDNGSVWMFWGFYRGFVEREI